MAFEFYKYQGTGNDFVIIDNRTSFFSKNDTKLVAQICDRKFGIGADGLLLLENHPELDFRMVYYNADGRLSSMCGNGGRCLVHFAHYLGIIDKEAQFEAIDGTHDAKISEETVTLQMNDVTHIKLNYQAAFLDTGSPHHVMLVNNLEDYDVFGNGRKIRHEQYGTAGANVNFVSAITENRFKVRTYERGVEAETLSCGTGVTAVAIAMHAMGKTTSEHIEISTPGGDLQVKFKPLKARYQEVYLTGPAVQVFKGNWS